MTRDSQDEGIIENLEWTLCQTKRSGHCVESDRRVESGCRGGEWTSWWRVDVLVESRRLGREWASWSRVGVLVVSGPLGGEWTSCRESTRYRCKGFVGKR